MGMPTWRRKIPWGLSPTQRTIDKWGKLGGGEVVFFKEVHTHNQSSDKWPALKTYVQVHGWTQQVR